MMEQVLRVEGANANPVEGRVVVDWPKAMWNMSMLVAAVVLCSWHFSWSGLLLFLGLTYVTLLLGHSVGMHRMLIHRSFKAVPWLEPALIISAC